MYQRNLFIFFNQKRFILILILLVITFFSTSVSSQPTNEINEYKIKTVVIDAGHGGKDSGAVGKKTLEKHIALAIALKLGHYIEQNIKDIEVIYTRKTDKFIELHKRGDIANKAHADLFISIHVNSFPNNSRISGTETYVMGLHTDERNFEVAKKENSVITFEEDYTLHYEGFDPNSTESYIIFSLMQNTFLDQSLDFASLVQDQFRDRAKRTDRGVRQAGFVVLWRTTMPSVLIETGYISNPREEMFLSAETGQDYIASAIFRAFRDYKKDIESRSDFSTSEPDKPVYFKVQVASSKKQIPADSRIFKGYGGIEEFRVGDWYKYAVGNTSSYNEIIELNKTIKKDFKDAFIIAVKEDKIIPVNEALNK